MSGQPATVPSADAERLWQEWRARGAAADRRTATGMRFLMLLVGLAIVIWSAVQLA